MWQAGAGSLHRRTIGTVIDQALGRHRHGVDGELGIDCAGSQSQAVVVRSLRNNTRDRQTLGTDSGIESGEHCIPSGTAARVDLYVAAVDDHRVVSVCHRIRAGKSKIADLPDLSPSQDRGAAAVACHSTDQGLCGLRSNLQAAERERRVHRTGQCHRLGSAIGHRHDAARRQLVGQCGQQAVPVSAHGHCVDRIAHFDRHRSGVERCTDQGARRRDVVAKGQAAHLGRTGACSGQCAGANVDVGTVRNTDVAGAQRG